MLKAVALFSAVIVGAAVAAPELLSRLTESSERAATLVPESSAPASSDNGGIVRLDADRNGHYFTTIEVNHRPLEALVDTGATVVALRYEDARSLGLVFPGDKFDVVVRTANGEGRARRVKLRSVSVGTISIRDVDALVADQGALSTNLLGMSFLNRLARFEVRRGQLVLER
jgi:aspartyl protease family protein